MPTSSSSRGRTADRSRSPLATLTRYDLVLAFIPTAFLLGTGTSVAIDAPVQVGLFGAAIVGALFVADALFRDPPVTGSGSGSGSGSGDVSRSGSGTVESADD